jgi:leader peptidase (prepilin peptidase)/N-methyltransferase
VESIIIQIWCTIVGLCIGSFLTVCIFRIPLTIDFGEDETEGSDGEAAADPFPRPPETSITFTTPRRSCCPKCEKQIKVIHNIPVFSWIFLGGKCAYCGAKIPWRYPLVELTTGILALVSNILFGFTLTALVFFLFGCAMIVITVIDYDYYIIPDVISKPSMAIGLLLGGLNQYLHFLEPPFAQDAFSALLGFMIGGGLLWGVAELYFRIRKIDGLGFGDVKLLGMTGAFFGAKCALYTIFLGSLVGSIFGISMMILAGRKGTHEIPFGPYLAAGTMYFLIAETLLIRFNISILPNLAPGF